MPCYGIFNSLEVEFILAGIFVSFYSPFISVVINSMIIYFIVMYLKPFLCLVQLFRFLCLSLNDSSIVFTLIFNNFFLCLCASSFHIASGNPCIFPCCCFIFRPTKVTDVSNLVQR